MSPIMIMRLQLSKSESEDGINTAGNITSLTVSAGQFRFSSSTSQIKFSQITLISFSTTTVNSHQTTLNHIMYTLTTLLTLFLTALTTASPIEAITGATRDHSSNVQFWHGDICTDNAGTVSLVGSGSTRCIPVNNARSISASGSGCTVKTWSGNNCRGGSFRVPDSGCHSVLYGSVSVNC